MRPAAYGSCMPATEPPPTQHPATRAVTAGRPPRREGAPAGPGIELSSTYVNTGTPQPGVPMYGRTDNATWELLEGAVAELEGAPGGATLFSSGMAAVAAVLDLVPEGGLLVLPRGAYNTTLDLAHALAGRGRLRVAEVDLTDLAAARRAAEGAAMVWAESPTNPLLEVVDLPGLRRACGTGTVLVVDNTFATPLLQRPFDLGADVVVHSATKYLSGHSDLLAGLALTRDPQRHEALRTHRRRFGAICGPVEAWLALRGLRTLAVRLDRAQANAAVLAVRLAGHPAVARVRFPGLPQDPFHEVAARQMSGFGAMISLEVAGTAAQADAVIAGLRLWLPATSLGGVESMAERRRRQPTEPTAVPENLIRLSVGIEDVEDLWADLDAALRAGGQPLPSGRTSRL